MAHPILDKIQKISEERHEIWSRRTRALQDFFIGLRYLDADEQQADAARLRAIERELQDALWPARRRERSSTKLQGGF